MLPLALLIAVGGFAALLFWDRSDRKKEAVRLAEGQNIPHRFTVNFDGTWYVLRDRLETYLIIGIDKESDRLDNIDPEAKLNNLQSDFLLLVVADRANQTLTALQLNRDSMAEIPRIGKNGVRIPPVVQQLALAHTYGSGGRDSCTNTVHAVSDFLYGVPIDHYFSITMDAVPVLTDLVGGVTVYVEDDFTHSTDRLPQNEKVTLRGELALTFVQGRRNVADGSNLNRMNRQRVYLNALYDKLKEKVGEENFPLKLASELAPYTVSDLLTEELAKLAERIGDYRFAGIETVPGETILGDVYMEFYPDEHALQEFLIRILFMPAT